MNVDTFFNYWGITENPFKAEEARDDPVYRRMMDSEMTHPDFEKIYGSETQPSTAIVFGEKGSGKTAIRLLLEQRISTHNRANPDRKSWLVKVDDLNPLIDSILRHFNLKDGSAENLKRMRLADHMDLLLSQSITRLVDFLLCDTDLELDKAKRLRKRLRRMPRQKRIDLAEMIALYDRPSASSPAHRWTKVRSLLRTNALLNLRATFWTMLIALTGTAVSAAAIFVFDKGQAATYAGLGVFALAFIALAAKWMGESVKLGGLARKIAHDVRVVEHQKGPLKNKLSDIGWSDLLSQPLPIPNDQESRFELTNRLLRVLEELGYVSMTVLYDRVDEPAAVNGDAQKMRSIIWPLFNNKFLQQNGIGFKLLLPMDLGHLLRKEDANFFQLARFDKQNLIERLEWTGPTLYDICSSRLQGCQGDEGKVKKLADLFDESVTPDELVDALDQMQQPRDAFKFLYAVIQEHCQNSTDETPQWRIPQLVLDNVRKRQSQRVKDLHRGLAPA
jgi:hypothetical protein